jgi:hypothetical protein
MTGQAMAGRTKFERSNHHQRSGGLRCPPQSKRRQFGAEGHYKATGVFARQHQGTQAEIVALLRQKSDEVTNAVSTPASPTSRPSWWPEPHPRIVREPPFGSDGAPPERYRAAWNVLLAQCPAGMAPPVWETAMYDAARLFGDFGIELERLAWKPADLFGMPHGLVWFIKGNYAAAIGATMVQLGSGRIWRAPI